MVVLSFAGLVRPVSVADFLRRHWDHAPALLRGQAWRSEGLIGGEVLERLIAESIIGPPDVRVVRNGTADADVPIYTTDGRANIASIGAAHSRGYTVVVNNVHKRVPALGALCRDAAIVLGHPVGANCYLTPPQAQGLARHFDDHDVFVLQVEGTKQWRVFEPLINFPLREQHVDLTSSYDGELQFEAELTPGDVLYLPRGCVHEATTGGERSLHVTLGVSVYRFGALLADALARYAETDVELRRATPPGLFSDADVAVVVAATLEGLAQRFASKADFGATLDELYTRFLAALDPLPDPDSALLTTTAPLTPASVVRARAGTICRVIEQGADAVIEFPGNAVRGPVTIAPALRFVSARERFRVGELPGGLTEESQVLLAQRLVAAGLLVPDGADA
jgi:ribosomal protein L16 Arg81 hydroxylase